MTRRRTMRIDRRRWLSSVGGSVGGLAGLTAGRQAGGEEVENVENVGDASMLRCKGLLAGSLIGDALGGPLEFADEATLAAATRRGDVAGVRQWSDPVLGTDAMRRLSDSLRLPEYSVYRRAAAPYGPWMDNAPAGTITDDSRMKIVLLRAMEDANERQQTIAPEDVARALVEFQCRRDQADSPAVAALCREGLREYRYAARWLIGDRDRSVALPVDRLWSGVANCSGQMMMLPLAIVHAGDPVAAYERCYRMDFVDHGYAKDFAAAVVAGLAAVVGRSPDGLTTDQRWGLFRDTIRKTDPMRLAEVPFAGRPLVGWLDLAEEIVDRCDGNVVELFGRLETDGRPVYYWDAHFTFAVAMTMVGFCHRYPLAALGLSIDFGHDTDSYGQLVGAIVGAIHGADVFPDELFAPVRDAMANQYGESIDRWLGILFSQRAMAF